MAFQFKRDRNENLVLTLAGDIDLEVTPDIKAQLASQLGDAASLDIDAAKVSYLDSSGVSILVIAMQSCKQKRISLSVSRVSEEAMRVLQLAKLDKILPIGEMTGKAHLVDVDVFSDVGAQDSQIADQVHEQEDMPAAADPMGGGSSDDDLIAALASGDMAGGDMSGTDSAPASSPEPAAAPPEPAPTPAEAPAAQPAEIQMTPEPAPAAIPEPSPAPAAPAAQPATPSPDSASDGSSNDGGGNGGGGNGGGGDGGSFTPGTFG